MANTKSNAGHRGNKAQAALAEAINGDAPVTPWPDTLPNALRELWRDTVNTKTGDYWNKGDIPLLEIYCRSVADIRRLSHEINQEGEVLTNAHGNQVINPKIVVRSYAENKLMGLCTKLRLQPSCRMDTQVEAAQFKKKTKAVRAARAVGEAEDSLLAGMKMQ